MSLEPEEYEPIPLQGPGPHFIIDDLGKLASAPPTDLDVSGNNVKRIRQMLPLVRQAAQDFCARLGSQSNSFPELARNAVQYVNEVSKLETEIEWGLLWGLGVVLEEAAVAAERAVAGQLEPPLEDRAQTALQGWRKLHPVLILATAEGAAMQAQADVSRMTELERAEVKESARDLAQDVRKEGIATEAATKILQAAVDAPIDGRHPERGAEFMIATVKNATIVLVSAAFVAGVAHRIGGEVGIAAGMAGWEVTRKSASFSSALAALGKNVDELRDGAEGLLQDGLSRLDSFWGFVKTRKTMFLRFSKSSGQKTWMDNFIYELTEDKLAKPTQPSEVLPAENIPENFEEQAKAMIVAGEVPPIAWRKSLHFLDFRGTTLNDLRPLSDLTSLKLLYIDKTSVGNLSPIKSLINLEILSLWAMPVTDISAISNCKNIHTLFAYLNEVVDWTPLRSLSKLQELYLFGANIADLSPIANLVELSQLDVSATEIHDLAPLSNLAKLTHLDVSETIVSDLSPLKNLKLLQELDLTRTRVTSVAPLRNMLSLKKLVLKGTKVRDISTLDHLRPELKIDGGPRRKPYKKFNG